MSMTRILLLAAGASEVVRLSGWTAPLRLTARSDASPEALAALVRDVERETELVPGVRRVTVRERGCADGRGTDAAALCSLPTGLPSSGWVRYEVEGVAYGLPWRVRIRKAWDEEGRFNWRSEGGTGRPEQEGALLLRPDGAGTWLELSARTRSALPLLGGAATLLVGPLFLAPTFAAWLRNLARAAEGMEAAQSGQASP